jgi:hypothetical protein
LDRATLLRWELDRIAGSQVRGDAVDVSRAVAASEALERLLSPTASFDAGVTESRSARNRLLQLLDAQAEVIEDDKSARIAALEAEVAQLKSEIDGKSAVIRSLGGTVVAKAATPTPPTPEQTTSPPEPQRSPQPPLPQPSSGVPQHYLANHGNEPWRRFVDASGNISPRGSGGGKYWGPVGE